MRRLLLFLLICFASLSGHATDFASQACLCTYKLFFPSSTGTCVLFSRPKSGDGEARETLLITAGHVLEGIPADAATLVLRRQAPDGHYDRVDTQIHIRKAGKPLWTRHPREDIAVLPLELADSLSVAALDLSALAAEETLRDLGIHVGSQLFSAVYPERRESNDEGFPIIRKCAVASFPFLPINAHRTFLIDSFAFHGDSGGPVFARDDRKGAEAETSAPVVVGLVLAMWQTNEKTETPTETREVHTGLGLATVVHAQFVREVIDLLEVR